MGDTTPPMNPTLHGRGGGAALSVASVHDPESDTVGNSANCTEPFRPNRLTDAGWGMLATALAAVALSGVTTRARDDESEATSSTWPAPGSQVLWWDAAADSAGGALRTAAESTRGGAFPRSQAATRRTAAARA